MKKIISILFLLMQISVFAQLKNYSSADIKHDIQKLNVVGSVLYIAAHPDDENTRLISYLTKEKGYRVGYLSLTRGDGGQNLIGNEQGEELGIIRTQELLAARNIDGAEQFFTRAYDFGYSKTAEETFDKWDKEKILEDVVFVIRYFKPDVIICRFPTTGEGGHGHHTASAILAKEAFEISDDYTKYPEQIKEVGIWKAERIFWNTFNFGSTNTTSEDQLKIDAGGYNFLLGKSYGEIAAEARSQHRSQAFGTERKRGEQLEYFLGLGGTTAKLDLFEGITTDFSRFEKSKKIIKLISKIQKEFDDKFPYKIIPRLIELRKELNVLVTAKNGGYLWFRKTTKKIENLIYKCSGVYFEVISTQPYFTNGDTIRLKLQMINRSPFAVKFSALQTPYGKITDKDLNLPNGIVAMNSWKSFDLKFLAKDLPYTSPYQHRYSNSENAKLEEYPNMPFQFRPESRWETTGFITFEFQNTSISNTVKINYKYVDPSFGEIYQPLAITPPVTINFEEEHYIFNKTGKRKIKLKVKSFKANQSAIIRFENSFGFKSDSLEKKVQFSSIGEEQDLTFEINYNQDINFKDQFLKAVAIVDGKEYSYSYHQIHYDHIPDQIWFEPAVVPFSLVNLETNTKKIAYLTGAGDKIPQVLQQLNYDVVQLNESDFSNADLSKFEVLITGVRAFNTLKSLKYNNAKILDFAKKGGIVVVQYNTSQSLVTSTIGPYPFKISRDRVTEEDCEVRFLKKDHPFLLYPNTIVASDFDNWIQERGLYFPAEISEQYETYFSMNDKTNPALNNAIISCNIGKGKFYYTGISYFRQLPAGVPGALKLFVNMISINEKPVTVIQK